MMLYFNASGQLHPESKFFLEFHLNLFNARAFNSLKTVFQILSSWYFKFFVISEFDILVNKNSVEIVS